MEIDNPSPEVRIDPKEGIIVKNRAYRRRFKNRAMLEGKPSKKYYTKKKKKSRRKK